MNSIDWVQWIALTTAVAAAALLVVLQITQRVTTRSQERQEASRRLQTETAAIDAMREMFLKAVSGDPSLLDRNPLLYSLIVKGADATVSVPNHEASPRPEPSREKAVDELRAKAEEAEVRLAAIELRLPSASTIEQVSSANEARMAQQIDHLERDLQKLEGRTLEKGAVYAISLTVVATLGTIVALVPIVLSLTTGAPAE